MVTQKGETMEEKKGFFDSHAHSWDRSLGYEEKTSRIQGIVEWFGLAENDSVLDVGTGTGILLPFIREVIGPKGRLVGIDFSFQMLRQAKIRQSCGDQFLINASVEWIPFPSVQFDRVTCFSAFPHFPNKARALSEMVRVLKSEGTLYIAHLHSVEEINQLHQSVGGPVARDFLPPPERIRSLMKDSGLFGVTLINEPGRFLARGRKI